LSLKVLGELRLHLFDLVSPLVPGPLGADGAGAVLSGFVSDAEAMADGFAKTTTAAVDVTASIVLGSIVSVLVEPTLGAIVLGGGLVVVAVSWALARAGRGLEARTAAERAQLASSVVQTVRSARELVAFGRTDLVEGRLDEVRRRSASIEGRRCLAAGLARAATVAAAGGVLAAVTGAGLAAADAHRLSGVMLAVVVFTTLAVMDQFTSLPAALAGANAGLAAAKRVEELCLVTPVVDEPEVGKRPVGVPGSGRLVDVVTAPVLKGICLDIDVGEHVALVGPSGSGKTTAVHALLHFLPCSAGTALLGETDVSCMTRESIAALAGWVPDQTHIFAASLGDNLRLGRPSATGAECDAALERAGLGEWAATLPAGLATLLGDGGRQVSAGERQRLSLARALLAGPPLLLLDEPTAHLDPATSAYVLAQLLDAAAQRSVLVVSHDAEIAGLVDRVVALDAGRVSRTGPGGRQGH
jgi:ABC-type transport system involved in cytochrome bd biosynthesis fused ATPase/permease subunit